MNPAPLLVLAVTKKIPSKSKKRYEHDKKENVHKKGWGVYETVWWWWWW